MIQFIINKANRFGALDFLLVNFPESADGDGWRLRGKSSMDHWSWWINERQYYQVFDHKQFKMKNPN